MLQAIEAITSKEWECCSTKLWSILVLPLYWRKITNQFRRHTSWRSQSWRLHASFQIFLKTFIKWKVAKMPRANRFQSHFILSQLQSNQFLLSIWMNGSNQNNFQKDMQDTQRASEKKQVPMDAMSGVFSEFISLRKLSSSSTVILGSLGQNLNEWFQTLKNFIKALNSLTKLSTLFLES